ncbi:MAG TPA: hypothetical protein VLV83_25455 [Acidobacteriota bacterium]|nr:hypothetical protein [Acidobacteriota bacterium]
MDSKQPENAVLTPAQLDDLIQRVFKPQPEEEEIAFLTDLPDREIEDTGDWAERRRLAMDWTRQLNALSVQSGRRCSLYLYRHTGSNNADLPEQAWQFPVAGSAPDQGSSRGGSDLSSLDASEKAGWWPPIPSSADDLDPDRAVPMEEIYRRFPIIIAPTQFSATAPMKQAARRFGFRGATMPGFNRQMIPALKLDYTEVDRRCGMIKRVLDQASEALFQFEVDGYGQADLTLDLRHRQSTASGGLVPQPGTTGNLPSGETYIVPYEGERAGDPSRTEGIMPVQFEDEVVLYVIRRNRAVEVQGEGAISRREADKLKREPAYGNIAELGVGVLGDFGIDPIGVILLDEKLAVHIAFGRSDHFGGQVSPSDFSSPKAVVHIDRVYHPKIQPKVHLRSVLLRLDSGDEVPLVHNDDFVFDFAKE